MKDSVTGRFISNDKTQYSEVELDYNTIKIDYNLWYVDA